MENYLNPSLINWTKKQLEVLNSRPNLIITGCPGTGKTLLAIHLAIKLKQEGENIALIVFTKSLRTFIHDCFVKNNTANIEVFYEREWDNKEFKNFEIIILDEFQDFSINDILRLTPFASKGIYLFGDIDQKLYKQNLRNEEILSYQTLVATTHFRVVNLDTNFRVPKNIVELITSIYKNVDPKRVPDDDFIQLDYKKKNIQKSNKESVFSEIIHLENNDAQLNWIVQFLSENKTYKNIGILFKQNKLKRNGYFINQSFYIEEIPGILETYEILSKNNVNCGYKFERDDRLSFQNSCNINLLTIHSSKGLEFDCVILPFYSHSNMNYEPTLPYVAFTRCNQKLIILYSGIISMELNLTNNRYLKGHLRKRTTNDSINPSWLFEPEKFKKELNELDSLTQGLNRIC